MPMRSPVIILALIIFLIGAAHAGTVCVNGSCFSCEGSAVCINERCTCNGVAAEEGKHRGPCPGQETVTHPNGGGKVAATASVSDSVYVSTDSAICGYAIVSGPTRLLKGSIVNGNANISGRSTLDGSTVNGSAAVLDSSVGQSALNGSASVSHSEILSSTINGSARVENSRVTSSVLNGSANVVGRQIEGAVLNY
jgi:hypothetical protein